MQPEDFDRDWEAASKELLTGMKTWRQAHPHATLVEIEAELDRRMRALRGEMLEDLAQASQLADLRGVAEAERPVCPQCGARLGPRGQETRTLRTDGDHKITLERSYAVCPHCQTGFFPPR
jgi:YgiT-type zinc finger domain-containing protein